MARIPLVLREPIGDQEAMLTAIEQTMGYLPNNLLIMAHWPELLSAFSGLGGTILHTGVIGAELKQLMAMVASTAHGCEYCQAHTSHAAHQHGASRDKVAAVFEFESSTLFTDRERAALRLAWHGALQPNQVSDADFEALRRRADHARSEARSGACNMDIVAAVAVLAHRLVQRFTPPTGRRGSST